MSTSSFFSVIPGDKGDTCYSRAVTTDDTKYLGGRKGKTTPIVVITEGKNIKWRTKPGKPYDKVDIS